MSTTKSAKKIRCAQILARGPHRVAPEDHAFLLSEVFPLHCEWVDKQGPGVAAIEVRRHGMYNALGFFLLRVDGTDIDISYRVAVDGAGTVWGRFVAAARTEVAPQVGAWKTANPAPEPGMHCDHVLPFDQIVRGWLAQVDLEASDVLVSRSQNSYGDLFLERGLAKSWHNHHRKCAAYQWLNAAENIRKSNKTTRVIGQYDLFARAA